MSSKDDDETTLPKTNAAPVLKPPGMALGGNAPPGAVGVQAVWAEGGVLITGDKITTLGTAGQQPESPKPPPPDRTTPRFHETDDPEVNRFYGTDHIMVRKDGSEMRPSDWEDEKAAGKEEQSLAEERGPEIESGEREGKPDYEMRPQLWEDKNRDDDDGIDR